MPAYHRRSATKVVAGDVRKKNNWDTDLKDYRRWQQRDVVIHREKPGAGFRHVVSVRDVQRLLDLLPERDSIANGLDAVVLAPGMESKFGRYRYGVVELRAWPADLSRWMSAELLADSPELFELLAIESEAYPEYDGWLLMHFTEPQARAFMLLDVLVHELGHHQDRMASKRQLHCGQGEPFANAYARTQLPLLWNRYCDAFGMP